MDAQSGEAVILEGFGKSIYEVKYLIFETSFHSIYESEKNFDHISQFLKRKGFVFHATNVSGKGKIRFNVMRIRGIFYNLRSFGLKGFSAYSGFFDVIFINKSQKTQLC
jgi:hypothetical protein